MRAAGALAGTIASISAQLIFIALMMAAVVFFGQRFGLFGDQITLGATSAASFGGEERSVERFTLLPKGGIRSIDDPSFIAAGDAEWAPTSPVIECPITGDARAYPLPVLATHEIVNDVGGGSAVAITYCPLSLTGIVFDRIVAGSVVEFGVSGQLLMNVIVIYDRDTDSLWSVDLPRGDHGAAQRHQSGRGRQPATHLEHLAESPSADIDSGRAGAQRELRFVLPQQRL